jgi:hypothetical protein
MVWGLVGLLVLMMVLLLSIKLYKKFRNEKK